MKCKHRKERQVRTKKEGAANRQVTRSKGIAAHRRKPSQSIAASDGYAHWTRMAAWVIGLGFGLMLFLGILAG